MKSIYQFTEPDWTKAQSLYGSAALKAFCGLAAIALAVSAVAAPTFTDANWVSMGGMPGADGDVYAAVVDSSGNLYIGGTFTIAGDVVANGIAKWDGNSWSALGAGVSGGGVLALAVSGNVVYAGGYFTEAGGNAANYIAKWDGSSWSALGSGMGGGSYPYVRGLAVSGSDVYAGGQFTTAGGKAADHIAKWHGSSWLALGSGINADVSALAVAGSDLYAGGYFSTAGGIGAYSIAKWDGGSWSALGSGMGTGGPDNSSVFAVAVSGSYVYAAGNFTTSAGGAANYIAQWDGSSWNAVGSGMGGAYPYLPAVYALALSGSDLFAGGRFTTAGGNAANYIAKWDSSTWSALGSGMAGYGPDYSYVTALAVSGSDLYAGGYFTTVGGIAANGLARWNGSSWSALGSGLEGGYQPPVSALAVSGSNVYAGGKFTTAGGDPANYVAKWNGNSWSALGSGMDGYVNALAVSGSNVYAGGNFTMAGGSPATNIAKWNGSSWSALGSGTGGGLNYNTVLALAVSGSDLYAGGLFTTAGGSAANYVAKWNGISWTALGSGMGGNQPYTSVQTLAVSGSNVYAGGYFTMAGGSPATNIAKWNGNSWSALGSGVNSYVLALAVSGSDVYVGGYFTTAGGSGAANIAKWNGSAWSALGSGMNNQVHTLVVLGSDVYAGGEFTTAGGEVSAYLARGILNPPILAIQPDGSGGFFINFSGVPGSAYRLQRALTLVGPWTSSASQITPASGLVEFWDQFPPPGQAFYRTVQP